MPVFAYLTTAPTPREAISSGYCCEVASMTPALTFRTPAHPPSTETIVVALFDFPAFFSAVQAPAALASLIVYTTSMSGFFWRQFSIAVWDGATCPSPLPTQAICLL